MAFAASTRAWRTAATRVASGLIHFCRRRRAAGRKQTDIVLPHRTANYQPYAYLCNYYLALLMFGTRPRQVDRFYRRFRAERIENVVIALIFVRFLLPFPLAIRDKNS